MGRHTKIQQPDDEPSGDAEPYPGRSTGPPPGPASDPLAPPLYGQRSGASFDTAPFGVPRFDEPPRSDAPPPFDPPLGAPPPAAPYAPTPAEPAEPAEPVETAPGHFSAEPYGRSYGAPSAAHSGPSPGAPPASPVPPSSPAPYEPSAYEPSASPSDLALTTRTDPLDPSAPQAPPDAAGDGPSPRPPSPSPSRSRARSPIAAGLETWITAFGRLPVPLLPIVALVVAVGVVAYALSTQQISLNFAGGAPKEPQVGAKDMSQRGQGERASRGAGRADGLVVAFRLASKTPGGFRATVTIANHGQRPVPRWALAFTIPNASVQIVSGAAVVKKGRLAHLRSSPGAAPLAPGRSVRITFAATGTAGGPNRCVLNRLPCARA